MSRPNPAAALNGVQTGPWCDGCNRRIDHDDKVGMYATWYDTSGWTPRRTWCSNCCPEEVEPGTDGADEVIIEAVFWAHRLVGVSITDRNRPTEQ